uniref:Putative ATPase domain containing protein n=1 Tax=viral metagenome TaxID=1070528 RepID=A0A6M3KYX8_9ZZZZ
MSNQGMWITDEQGQDTFVYYSELEHDIVQSFIKPIGGFMFPADMFMMSKLPSAPFYVQDWLPKRGKTLLYAPPKTGKSFLSLQLARCVASGEPFLGLKTTKGRVAYTQFELGEEILQARLKQTGMTYEDVFVGTSFSLKLDTEHGQKMMWSALEAVEPHVLIIDPLYKAIAGDENESSDVRRILDFLDSIIEGFNCSIFLIHHAGKDLTKRGRGSSVFEDWVDSYLQMQRTSKAGEALKVKIKPIFLRHASLPPDPIEAELGNNFEFFTNDLAPTVKQQVEAFIRIAGSAVSPAEIFAAQIGSNTSVYKALKQLMDEGKVVKAKWGFYEYVR